MTDPIELGSVVTAPFRSSPAASRSPDLAGVVCGVCGVVRFEGSPVQPSVVARMVEAAAHRGPGSVRVAGGAVLAQQARVPDPAAEAVAAEAGAADGRAPGTRARVAPARQGGRLLVADARLDNREELCARLDVPGGTGDAELILHARARWGRDCAERLLGDFAFVVWDAERRHLFAARDPMGMRALYYRAEPEAGAGRPERVAFATEVKQLLALEGGEPGLEDRAVAAYLAGHFGPPELTFYRGIRALPPGCALEADGEGVRTWRYRAIDPGRRIEYRREEEYAEHFLELFEEAVRCRLRGDRPAALFLSGGLDSGSIASVAGRLLERGEVPGCAGFRAYSWAFRELPGCDERWISDGIAERYGFPAVAVPGDDAWPLSGHPAHGPDADEPYVGVYQALLERTLAWAAADGVGVMMSGDRGDLTMGEPIFDYPALALSGRWWTLARELRLRAWSSPVPFSRIIRTQLLRPLAERLWPPDRARPIRRRLLAAWRRVREGASGPRTGAGPNGSASPAPPAGQAGPPWLTPAMAATAWQQRRAAGHGTAPPFRDPARRERHRAVFTPMHMTGATASSRAWARHGLVFADPWSDRRIVEFAIAVPQRVLNTTGNSKRLVRRAMRGVMPEPARRSARKISPYPLMDQALRWHARSTIERLLADMEAERRGYLDGSALRGHYEAVRRGGRMHPCFWWALTLEMWLRCADRSKP